MTAITRYGTSWPDYDGEMVRIDAGTELKVLYKAAEQDIWRRGTINDVNKNNSDF